MKKTACVVICALILSASMTACALPEFIGDRIIDAMGDVAVESEETKDTEDTEDTEDADGSVRESEEPSRSPETLPALTESADTAETEAEDEKAEKPYASGFTVGQTYSNAWIGIRFMTPEIMTLCTKDEVADILGESTDSVSYEMMATDVGSGASVILLAEKLAISGVSVKQYINIVKTQYGADGESKVIRENFKENIAGISFTGVEYENSASGLSQDIYVAKKGDRFIVILITYSEDSQRDIALAGFMEI